MDSKKIILVIVVIIIVAILAFTYISANSHTSKIEVESNKTLKNGDSFVVVLKDDRKNVIPNQVIDFKILDDKGWATKYNATTDENGHATVKLFALENGNYTVHSVYNGTMFLSKSKSISDLNIDDGLQSSY